MARRQSFVSNSMEKTSAGWFQKLGRAFMKWACSISFYVGLIKSLLSFKPVQRGGSQESMCRKLLDLRIPQRIQLPASLSFSAIRNSRLAKSIPNSSALWEACLSNLNCVTMDYLMVLSVHNCDKIPKVSNLKRWTLYFGLQFHKFQAMVTWPCCLWTITSQKTCGSRGPSPQSGQEANREKRGPGSQNPLQGQHPHDLTSSN